MTSWTAADIPDQRGRTAIVTGATSGLGLETATQLARHGARVMLAVRNVAAGERTASALRAASGADVVVEELDLASLASVRRFAERVLDSDPRLDTLVNNAGAESFGPRQVTEDGFEFHLGTNVLGHFALTGLLLPALARSASARVVSLSSITHKRGHLNFDDLQIETTDFSGLGAYSASKLAATVFGIELDRRLRAAQSQVLSVIAHPGVARTNFTARALEGRNVMLRWLGGLYTALGTQPVERGALPQLYAATAPGVAGGQFFGPDGRGEQRGDVTTVKPSAEAADPAVGARLWAAAEKLTDVRYL